MFARGESYEAVAAQMNISLQRARNHYLLYLDTPLDKRMRISLLPQAVAGKDHRLADDIEDIERINALLRKADEKNVAPLLEVKRKIKERMMKELIPTADTPSDGDDARADELVMEAYRRVFPDIAKESGSTGRVAQPQ
jgi:hypothetical protein